jgi:hypothetical protein
VLFTDSGHRFQAAIIESDTTSRAQTYLIAGEKSLELKTNVTATNVISIEGVVNYDDESIVLFEPTSSLGEVVTTDVPFGKKFTVNFTGGTKKGDTLIHWRMTPILPEEHVVNLTSVTLRMTDGDEALTTEGTGEF